MSGAARRIYHTPEERRLANVAGAKKYNAFIKAFKRENAGATYVPPKSRQRSFNGAKPKYKTQEERDNARKELGRRTYHRKKMREAAARDGNPVSTDGSVTQDKGLAGQGTGEVPAADPVKEAAATGG